MNNGRLWCVVNPSVGLPLFLGGVATISLLVHTSVMTNTTWMSSYWQGTPRSQRAEVAPDPAAVQPARATADQGFAVNITPVAASDGSSTSFVVTIVPRAPAPEPVREVRWQQVEAPPPDTTAVR
jgi:light-harvesting protein B-800-850 alpha chain